MSKTDKIKIRLPDGTSKDFAKGIRPKDIIAAIGSRSLTEKAVVAQVDGQFVDLDRPIMQDSNVKIITVDEPDGMETYWHSTSHIMAHAVKELFPEAQFGVGPPIENGFYYDIDIDTRITQEELERIEKKMQEVIAADQPFQRREMSKEEAIAFFKEAGDGYKLELLRDLEDDCPSTYTEGSFVDLCRGPHIPSTGKIKTFKLLSVAGAYWRGDEQNKMLQRIYGISFPKKQQLNDYLQRLEEAKKRDHKKLGKELELFLLSPKVGIGLPVWLPNGTIIRETLENFLKEEQRKRGYLPVVTPHIGNIELYKTSGHYPFYKESQFAPLKCDKNEEYLLRPMNCPHHFQIYSAKPRSYRDLPVRYAEFGTVYRYEQSGELSGLVRVRGFTQDDSHLFVRQDQLKAELCDVIDLTQFVFSTLGFKDFTTQLSFRDQSSEKYGGSHEQWRLAQKDIKAAADEMAVDYKIVEGEAAFYGPKLDFMIKDVLGRKWQLGTVQVDYVMPERFDLEYVGSDNQKHRPVVIHRAPFGSFERFIGILIEHYAGAFPTWLAPVQVVILPISDDYLPYGREINAKLVNAGLRVSLDDRNEKIGYKIREAETQKIPYMLIVGKEEVENNNVAVRKRKKGDLGKRDISLFLETIIAEIDQKEV
jgi:threonyl-tRNA synthetase